MIDSNLGKYEIIEHIGQGGMAEVYKAYQPSLDRYVAIKVLHTFLANRENLLIRFRREAWAVANLHHPNIVHVYDFEQDKERGLYYMVMEFIEGPSLKVRLEELAERGECMPLDEAIDVVTAVGEALGYAHRRDMIHRDVKPANIMFTEEGQVILTDFGIAKMLSLHGLTASGAMVGTPSYISPELAQGDRGDERSDIYSLGVVLYELLAGVPPFESETPIGVILKHINDVPPLLRDRNLDLPSGLDQVLSKALAKDPDDRYESADAFVEDLKRVAAGREPSLAASETVAEPSDNSDVSEAAQLPPSSLSSDADAAVEVSSSSTMPPDRVEADAPQRVEATALSPEPSRKRAWLMPLAIIAALIISLMGAAGILASTDRLDDLVGRLGLLSTPENSSAQDQAATEVAATLVALEAKVNATDVPSPTPTSTSEPTRTPDATATKLAACVFDVEVVGENPVFLRTLAPDQEFTVYWELKNTGTCALPAGVEIASQSSSILETVTLPEIESIPVEETVEIVATFRAPSGYGVYTGTWQLQDSEGEVFGEELEVSCQVAPTPIPRTMTPSATPTLTPTKMAMFTPTPVEELWMGIPGLVECNTERRGGRVTWGYGGGFSDNYRFFYSRVSPEYELDGPYHKFTSFPHVVTYFTTSGELDFPVPDECGSGDYGHCGSSQEGFEIVWVKLMYGRDDCP